MDDKYKECGEEWARSGAEADVLSAHDREHPGDPRQYWGECNLCAEKVEAENEHNDDHALDQMVAADIEHQEHGV